MRSNNCVQESHQEYHQESLVIAKVVIFQVQNPPKITYIAYAQCRQLLGQPRQTLYT